MTEQETGSSETALEASQSSDNHTKLERLVARALENYSAEDGAEASPSDAAVMLSEKYSGPFAHPAVLGELNKVVENGAERAFQLTEKEQAHRHELEKAEVDSVIRQRDKDAADRRLVIILVFAFLSLCLVGAFVSIMTAHPAGGGLVAGAGAIITGAALLTVRSKNNKKGQRTD
jgi:uncharacterized membrane protein